MGGLPGGCWPRMEDGAAVLAGMDRQSLRARRGLLAASPAAMAAKVS